MTTIDRRHRGRAIRRTRRRSPGTGLVFVTITTDLRMFQRKLARLLSTFESLSIVTTRRPRQLLHNGKKP